MTDAQKARLTTWLVDQRMQGVELPEITDAVVKHAIVKRTLGVHERADRLLRFIARQSGTVAEQVGVTRDTLGTYAWTESTTWPEVDYYMRHLREMGWVSVTAMSSAYLAEIRTIAKSSHPVESAPTRLSRERTSPSRRRGRESTVPTPAFAGAGSWSPAISEDDGANRTTLQSSCSDRHSVAKPGEIDVS